MPNDKEKSKLYQAAYYLKHRDAVLARTKKYQEDHKNDEG